MRCETWAVRMVTVDRASAALEMEPALHMGIALHDHAGELYAHHDRTPPLESKSQHVDGTNPIDGRFPPSQPIGSRPFWAFSDHVRTCFGHIRHHLHTPAPPSNDQSGSALHRNG